MDSVILTVWFGGEWGKVDGSWVFVGKQSSKVFVIDKKTSLDGLKRKIVERFHVDVRKYNVILSHLYPNHEDMEPFCIDEDEDLKAFFKVNDMGKVAWSLLLHVVLDSSGCGTVDVEVARSGDHPPVASPMDAGAGNSRQWEVGPVATIGSVELNMHEPVEDRNIGGEDSNADACVDEFFGVAFVGDEVVRGHGDGEGGYRCLNDPVEGSDDSNVAHENDVQDEEGESVEEEDWYHSDSLYEFEPNVGSDERRVEKGRIFSCKQDLHDALSLSAVRDNFEFRVKKSTKSLWVVGCTNVSCEWRLRATKLANSNYFQIRKCTDAHSCALAIGNAHHRQASYKLIAKRIRER